MKSTRVLIGGDPELILEDDNGKYVSACEIATNESGCFSHDGNQSVAEVRFKPQENPMDCLASIRASMEEAPDEAKGLKWKAGAHQHGFAIGGHIHLGFPDMQEVHAKLRNGLKKNLRFFFTAIRDALEDKVQTKYRTEGGYGAFGEREEEIRTQTGRLEYRPPLSWLTSPGITLAYLSLAKAITVLTLEKWHKAVLKVSKTGKPITSYPIVFRKPGGFKWLRDRAPSDCQKGIGLIEKFQKRGIDWNQDCRKCWEIK